MMRHIKIQCKEIARKMLMKHEGLRLKPYSCSAGKLTIGFGRNLEDKGITEVEAHNLLDNDIDSLVSQLIKTYPWFRELNDVRKAVVIDMAFNLGLAGFSAFKKTIAYLTQHDYSNASREMLNSKWAMQVGYRANELSKLMENGELRSEK